MREKGTKNKKDKYEVKYHDLKLDEWVSLGKYPSYQEIADKFGLSYDLVRNIRHGRNKKLLKFLKIEKLE